MLSNEQSNSSTQSNLSSESPAGGFDVEKIIFILFSHKWKILISGTLGLIAAACVYFFLQKPLYKSEAKLLVRYVVEALAVDQLNTQIIGGRNMAGPLSNEAAIITSLDLSREVAELIPIEPEKLVPHAKELITVEKIMAVISSGLKVDFGKYSKIINVSFTHPDSEVPTEVLNLLISKYFEKHIKTYRSDLAVGVLDREIFEVKETLNAAEESITELMAGIISVADEQRALSERKQSLNEQIALAETDFSAQKRRVELLQNLSKPISQEEKTDMSSSGKFETNQPTLGDVGKFESLLSRLELLNVQKAENSLIHKPSSNTIKIIQQQIDATENEKSELIARFPTLAMIEKSPKNDMTVDVPISSFDPKLEKARLAEMEVRLGILNEEKKKLESEIKRIAQVVTDVAPHQRRKEVAKIRLESLEAAKSRADRDILTSNETNQAGLPNISIIQRPSVAFPVASDLTMKISLGLAGGGFAFGIGLALIIELFLDRSVKRSKEFEARLHIPLMLSIPYISKASTVQTLTGDVDSDDSKFVQLSEKQRKKKNRNQTQSLIQPWKPNYFIRPFTDTIRDRFVCYFRIDEMTNNTELIALTGFLEGSGISSIATGLAASFAEIDRKTLYVNLNVENFLSANTESDIIEIDADLSLLNDDLIFVEQEGMLFMANINFKDSNRLNRQITPKRLYELILKLKSSNFEYVIFDMPPLGPTSPTLTMSNFMNKVIMVVAAGKTSRDDIRHSYKELVSGNADVFTVFNNPDEKLSSWPKS